MTIDYLLGILIIATVVGGISETIAKTSVERDTFRHRLDNVKNYMRICTLLLHQQRLLHLSLLHEDSSRRRAPGTPRDNLVRLPVVEQRIHRGRAGNAWSAFREYPELRVSIPLPANREYPSRNRDERARRHAAPSRHLPRVRDRTTDAARAQAATVGLRSRRLRLPEGRHRQGAVHHQARSAKCSRRRRYIALW